MTADYLILQFNGTHACISSCGFSLLPIMPHVLTELPRRRGGIVYIFICLCLCSAAELTRYHFAQAAGMIQLKGVISQNALMMAEMLELTGLYREGERWHAVWGSVCSFVVLWPSGSTAGSWHDKISLPLLLLEKGKDNIVEGVSLVKEGVGGGMLMKEHL